MNLPIRRLAPSEASADSIPKARPRLRALRGGWSDDPAAPSFAPLRVPASNFESREIVLVSPTRLEVRPTGKDRSLAVAISLAGLCLLAVLLFDQSAPAQQQSSFGAGIMLVMCALFQLAALTVWRAGGSVTIDTERGEFIRSGGVFQRGSTVLDKMDLQEVSAVQLLETDLVDEEANWTIYQVNLVQKDGTRAHVSPHVHPNRARDAARQVADIIGVPVIDSPEAWRNLPRPPG